MFVIVVCMTPVTKKTLDYKACSNKIEELLE